MMWAILKIVLQAFARRLESCVTPMEEVRRRMRLLEESEPDVSNNLAEITDRTLVNIDTQFRYGQFS